MSTENEENAVHIDAVDVELFPKESGSSSELSCDSGFDTIDSCSASCPASSIVEVTPVLHLENNVETKKGTLFDPVVQNDHSSMLTSSTSISPMEVEKYKSEHLPDFVEDSKTKNDASVHQKDELDELNCTVINNQDINICTEAIDTFQCNKKSPTKISSCIQKELVKSVLSTSTVSLDEQSPLDSSLNKLSHSHSAENISSIDLIANAPNLNSSTDELNTNKILSDFKVRKNKASATQKITPDTQNDSRYLRLPKDIVSQDLGSIVKNVHGIFSSVSGSLKNAYNARAHQKPVIKHDNPPTLLNSQNSRVISDIFEEHHENSTPDNTCTNTLDDKTIAASNTCDSITTNNNLSSAMTDHQDICENWGRLFTFLNKAMVDDALNPREEALRLSLEAIERNLSEQRKQNFYLQEKVKLQTDKLMEKEILLKELEPKVDVLNKRYEQACREKDAAVMRYASVECAAIEAKKAAENSAKAEKAAAAEVELLNTKLKSAHGEKHRICQLYDDKCHELVNSEREMTKVREEMRELENRLKWTQSKLRMEMDAYKESAERVEKLNQQLTEFEASKEAAAANATDSARTKQLEIELKECQAALILCRHEAAELEKRLSMRTQQYEACAKERDDAAAGLARTTKEVEQLKINNLRLEEEAAELAALRAQAALADTLSSQLHRESERASQAEQALSKERARAETCARREAAALEHAAKLTSQHVAARAICNDLQSKAQALSLDNASLRERLSETESDTERLRAALSDETERRTRENKTLARKVAELTGEIADVNEKLEWEKGENNVLKKKHTSAIKELNRELQRALKRCEQLEAKLPPPDAHSTRTGSLSSLSSGESAPQEDRLQNGHADTLPDIQVREPDRQALIERIVSLQRAGARRAERCEFLEEHARQLTAELRNKARLLRQLVAEMQPGGLASARRDDNKKEIARLGGGAMAAVWGGDPSGMTLELSLEVNNKLQALLEDTLLKNITLKENMDTLGEEIARLKKGKSTAENK